MPIKINNPLNTSRVNYHLATGHSTNYNYDFLLSVSSAHKLAMCSFLVSAQEMNQRKRLVDALAAKYFAAAKQIPHG